MSRDLHIPGYEIQAKIGEGAMATVYRAVQSSLGRPVALKVLKPQLAADPDFVRRFQREAQMAAGLKHGHIVGVFDYGRAAETHYIAMELLEGQPLEIVLRDRVLSPQQAYVIIRQIGDALDYAHRQPERVVHRDIKPGNIIVHWVGQGYVAWVTDFGIARGSYSPAITQATSILGTPYYLSPEQCLGKPATPRSDLYSLGVVLFEMLTSRRPFEGEDVLSIYYKHINEPPPPISRFRPELRGPLEQVVMKALEKNPAQRFGTAAELAEAFRNAWLPEPESGTGTASSRRKRWGSTFSRHKRAGLAISSAILATTSLALLFPSLLNDLRGSGAGLSGGGGAFLPPPRNVRIRTSSRAAELQWENTSPKTSQFEIERRRANLQEPFRKIGTVAAGTSRYTDRTPPLTPATHYIYRIRAASAELKSNYFELQAATKPAPRYDTEAQDLAEKLAEKMLDSQSIAGLRRQFDELKEKVALDASSPVSHRVRARISHCEALLAYIDLLKLNPGAPPAQRIELKNRLRKAASEVKSADHAYWQKRVQIDGHAGWFQDALGVVQ